MSAVWNQYVVYSHPTDFPSQFVVRRWEVIPGVGFRPTSDHWHADSLDKARLHIPTSCKWTPRAPDDDAVIVEVWLDDNHPTHLVLERWVEA